MGKLHSTLTLTDSIYLSYSIVHSFTSFHHSFSCSIWLILAEEFSIKGLIKLSIIDLGAEYWFLNTNVANFWILGKFECAFCFSFIYYWYCEVNNFHTILLPYKLFTVNHKAIDIFVPLFIRSLINHYHTNFWLRLCLIVYRLCRWKSGLCPFFRIKVCSCQISLKLV